MIGPVTFPSGQVLVRSAGPHLAALEADLTRVADLAIYFGHQSVGGNLLDGVRELASPFPKIPLRIVEVGASLARRTFGHAYVGENGRPESKLAAFAWTLDSGVGSTANVALLKLCYSDVHRGTDPVRLFAGYEATLAGLRARHPRVFFAHVTAPLTAAHKESGRAAVARRLLGRSVDDVADNAARENFNDRLRRAYPSAAVFDLAKLESIGPGGDRIVRRWKGRDVPMLHPAYTEDGGHLNAPARVRLARQLLGFLSALPRPS